MTSAWVLPPAELVGQDNHIITQLLAEVNRRTAVGDPYFWNVCYPQRDWSDRENQCWNIETCPVKSLSKGELGAETLF